MIWKILKCTLYGCLVHLRKINGINEFFYRLFSESFQEDLETIFEVLPQKRQNLLFSATITDDLKESKMLSLNKDVSNKILMRRNLKDVSNKIITSYVSIIFICFIFKTKWILVGGWFLLSTKICFLPTSKKRWFSIWLS